MNEKLTLEWCFKYYNARIIIADTTTFANVRCMGIPNSPQALDALEKYGQLQLRPLSSLTDEEKDILNFIDCQIKVIHSYDVLYRLNWIRVSERQKDLIDKFREWNIDIDGLQERGIAVYE